MTEKASLDNADHSRAVAATDYAGIELLYAAESCLPGYNADIVKKIAAALAASNQVLEFGAGLGTLAALYRDQTGNRPECLEIDPKLKNVLTSRGFVCYESAASIPRKFDGVYTSNVLEHIEDDVAALREINRVLQDDGVLVIYVPAFRLLFSDLDRAVGHVRRYRLRELEQKLAAARFSVTRAFYVDSIGFFASLALRIFGFREGDALRSKRSLQTYDRYIYPLSSLLDSCGLKHVLGKNVFVVARKVAAA
jgi:SAM-dependent methyltransferase